MFKVVDNQPLKPPANPARGPRLDERTSTPVKPTLLMTWGLQENATLGTAAVISASRSEPREVSVASREQTTGPPHEPGMSSRSPGVDAALGDLAARLFALPSAIEPTARCLLTHARRLTQSERGWVVLIDPRTGSQRVHSQPDTKTSADDRAAPHTSLQLADGPERSDPKLWTQALETREPFFTNAPPRPTPSASGADARSSFRNFLAVPVMANGELLGQVALCNATHPYSLEHVDIVKCLAGLYGTFLRQRFIAQRREAEASRFRRIAARLADIVYSYTSNAQGGFSLDWLAGCGERMTGYTLAELKAMRCWSTLVWPEDRELFHRQVLNPVPGASGTCELRLKHRNGRLVWAASFAECVRDALQPNLIRIYGALTDITRRREAEQRMRLQAAAFDSTRDGMMIADSRHRIVAVNRAFEEMTGYREVEVLGRNPRILSSGRHDSAFYHALWSALQETGHWQGEIWNRRRNGETYPSWQTISAIRNSAGEATHYVAIFRDISQRKLSESQLERMAHFDPLTELPNRLLLKARLEHALDRARRRRGRVAVLFVDLDHFKTVNDSLGHPAGDELLAAVARRFNERLRHEDTLGRLGGDEFLVIVEDLHRVGDATVVAQALLESLNRAFTLGSGRDILIRASIGISIFPDDGADAAELIRNADAAMYQAKNSGRNAYACYAPALTREASTRLEMAKRLRHALERDEFVLHYQPVASMADGAVIGAEALVRWQAPGGELILPARFLQIAEETGVIIPLGEWVLRRSCRQGKAWLDAGLSFGAMSLNLSVRQFQQGDLESSVGAALSQSGLPGACLAVEITEQCLLEQNGRTERSLQALKAMGVSVSIDDFGTGYCSLISLKRLPIDRLKIDCSFISKLPDDPNQLAITRTVIGMAHHLGLRAIAEGVETNAQLDILRAQGCDAYQGFLFCPPLPAEEFAARYLRRTG